MDTSDSTKIEDKSSGSNKESKPRNSLSNSSFSRSTSKENNTQQSNGRKLSIFDHDSGKGRLASQIAHIKSHKRHKEYELTYDMMLGIRTFVSMSNVKPVSTLDIHINFHEKQRLFFPSEGSPITPPHAMRSFHFTDYCSEAFKRLRKVFGVNPADYLMDLCGDFAYLKFLTNSKSGQFFFYSHDRRYLIKTISKSEKNVLRRIMENYYNYIIQQKNSLLTKFVGLHSVEVTGIGKKYFIIMLSVFDVPTGFELKHIFDLKGSSYGRNASEKDKEKEVPMLKDNDARNTDFKLKLGDLKEEFSKQIELDSEFLRRRNIIDYSLLVGEIKDNNQKSKRKPRMSSVWMSSSGMQGSSDKVYFVGIIDILVEYKTGKKMESFFKGLIRNKNEISVIDPSSYSKRFIKFINSLVDE